MQTALLSLRKSLNKSYLKVKPNRTQIEAFKKNITNLFDQIKESESEEFHKNIISEFLKNTYYSPNNYINTKGRSDLVIHNGKDSKSTVGVLFEVKKPNNKSEMPTCENLNTKAFHELILYYLRERILDKNFEVKHTLMKSKIALTVLLLTVLIACQRKVNSDFKTIQVNKKIKDFPNAIDLTSPLKAEISIDYLIITGRDSYWYKVNSERLKPFYSDTTVADSQVPENLKNRYLNSKIREIITYRDSVAWVISEENDSSFLLRWLNLEHNKWVNDGEDGRKSIEAIHQLISQNAEKALKKLRKVYAFSSLPKDTTSFINYLKENGCDPIEFILDKLKKYKLVSFGEIHRRKASWSFLQNVAKDKRFPDETGAIFLELGSDKQGDIDKFMSNKNMDTELLLNIFRDYIISGWNDKDKFDFIKSIWLINKNLPSDKKIKILAVDTPRPFKTFMSRDDMKKNDSKYNRDEYMADTIYNYLISSKDSRNSLFIVGTGHVCKASNSAGSILNKKMPSATYSIFQHSPQVDNFVSIDKRLRHGIFDYAFYRAGDKPIAFEIKSSPFGKEPFDGLYYDGIGTYQDNYDGYIFFGSLDNEPNGEILLDLYSDNFIKELDRRYQLQGSNLKDSWGLKDLSKKTVIEKVMSDHANTRWGNIIKPLNNGITTQ
jgi:hypothetical protein